MEGEVELTITDVAYGGWGVGRWGGRIVFVPYTVTGDRVVVDLVENRKNYLYGRLQEIREPSLWRVEPRCPYFRRCGGCQMQEIGYDYQLKIKSHQVEELFRRIGHYAHLTIGDPIPSPSAWHYRGKMEFHAAINGEGRRIVGLKRERSSKIIEVERCLLAHNSINRALASLQHDDVTGRIPLWAEDDARAPDITRKIKGETFLVPRHSFFQANLLLTERLVDLVVELAGPKGGETVIDAYCGVGLFTRFLAQRAESVIGIEFDGRAVAAARKNLHAVENRSVQVIVDTVERALTCLMPDLRGQVRIVVVDPPRPGLSRQALEAILAIEPQRIVYVSCNPATMARDASVLADHGYRLDYLVPIDMFPHTAHVEVIGRWEKGMPSN